MAEGWNEQLRKEKLDEFCMTVDQLTPLFGKVAKDLADVLFAALPEAEKQAVIDGAHAVRSKTEMRAYLHRTLSAQ